MPSPAGQPVKVLDLGRFFSAPVAATLLADLGAEVVKLEDPVGGDPARGYGHGIPGLSNQWLVEGRNKYSATLNLREQKGRECLLELVDWADVLVENFTAGSMQRWGLGYETLSARNRRLVQLSISGFGQTGPYNNRGALDGVAAAFGGLTFVTGESTHTPPLRPNYYVADYLAAVFGALGIMTALHRRDSAGSDGRGDYIDLALYEPLLRIADSAFVDYAEGVVRTRTGGTSRVTAPGGVYPCADSRWVQINVSNEATFLRFGAVVGPVWPTETGLVSAGCRSDLASVEEITRRWTSSRDAAAVVSALNAARVPATVVNSVADLYVDPQIAARGNLVPVSSEVGSVIMQGVVPSLANAPSRMRWAGRPLGADNAYVYGQILGKSSAEIDALHRLGVI